MLVVLCREHLDAVREWARQNKLLETLDAALFDLGEVIGRSNWVELYSDFAPHSFDFCLFRIENPDAPRGTPLSRGRFVFNGGLIYHGPNARVTARSSRCPCRCRGVPTPAGKSTPNLRPKGDCMAIYLPGALGPIARLAASDNGRYAMCGVRP
jgi:hypothetical protein